MKKTVATISIFLIVAISSAVIAESASLKGFLFGSEPNSQYDNWISHLAEGIASEVYNVYAPYDVQRSGFGSFRIPDTSETLYWNNMLDLFIDGNYEGAQEILSLENAPFQIVEFYDTDTDHTYYMIRELPDMSYNDDNGTEETNDDEHGAFLYGWGIFIYNPSSTNPIIITVPHPCDDFPAPIMAYDALIKWNARYLMINGAGREVEWTQVGRYDNSKSISDPSRNASHPFHLAYMKFADAIRSSSGLLEFSSQIHSYDWSTHIGYANCQISAGNPRNCPNLPIRDLSYLKHDLINQGNHLMVPASSVGSNRDVFLNDFYSVNYSIYDFIFTDGVNTYAVNNSIDLPAYSQNKQMLYTQAGTNDYDVYEPFFHVEMDELPNVYGSDSDTYNWFYGWNEELETWDMDNLFTNFVSYYGRWIDDMTPVLTEMFRMDDGENPTNPVNLTVLNQTESTVNLGWECSSAYDFGTYEILYAREPIGEDNYQILDRDDLALLASQACVNIALSGLIESSPYYFIIRAKDKNGNYSALSNEVHINDGTLPVELSSFTAIATAQQIIRLDWTTQSETNLSGYYVYRNTFNHLASSFRIPSMIAASNTSQETEYTFTDREVVAGHTYYYWLECVEMSNETEFHGPVSVTLIGGEDTPPAVSAVTELLAAYPNPFNPSTKIPYSIKNGGLVSIEIHNQKGQLIWKQTKTHNLAGYYSMTWHGIDLLGKPVSSGIYIYRMICGKYITSKKIVLLK